MDRVYQVIITGDNIPLSNYNSVIHNYNIAYKGICKELRDRGLEVVALTSKTFRVRNHKPSNETLIYLLAGKYDDIAVDALYDLESTDYTTEGPHG
jgi:hypothetical protein